MWKSQMWKNFYAWSSPKKFYVLSGRFLPFFLALAVLCFSVGLVGGLWWAPSDYQQGDAFRIIYVHVPAAFLSLALYALMGVMSALLLIWRIQVAGILMRALAEVGALMTLIALITGSLWGKPMWGTWWIWDARLTSEFVLFLMYLSILAVHRAFVVPEIAHRLMAILVLVGIIDLPIIHYSVYWWNTLHQGQTLSILAKPKIDPSMLYPLLMMLLGFLSYSGWAVLWRARQDLVWLNRRQHWVGELYGE